MNDTALIATEDIVVETENPPIGNIADARTAFGELVEGIVPVTQSERHGVVVRNRRPLPIIPEPTQIDVSLERAIGTEPIVRAPRRPPTHARHQLLSDQRLIETQLFQTKILSLDVLPKTRHTLPTNTSHPGTQAPTATWFRSLLARLGMGTAARPAIG